MNKSLELLKLEAETNLFALSRNPYPGRGIITGLDETGEDLVQVYWIMGRSENSRNRVFGCDADRLFTEAADPAKVKDASLIIYNAMREVTSGPFRIAVVSNGNQTDGVVSAYADREGLHNRMRHYAYEPDAPNFTPRITASTYWAWMGASRSIIRMSILRKSPWSNACDRHTHAFGGIDPGFGYCFHTYSGDGDPLPAFRGEPYLLPLVGDCSKIMDTYWETLNPQNRVSIAVKFIPRSGKSHIAVTNRFAKLIHEV